MIRKPNTKDILFLSPAVPDKAGHGTQKRSAAHLTALTSSYRVHLVIFAPQVDLTTANLQPARTTCANVLVVPRKPQPVRPTGMLRLPPFSTIRELIQPLPRRVAVTDETLKNVAAQLEVTDFHCAFCFTIPSAVLLDRLLQITPVKTERKIVDFNDIESVNAARSQQYDAPGFEQAFINKLRCRQLKKLEDFLLLTYDDVLVCSDVDRKFLQAKGFRSAIHAVPNSVPLEPAAPENTDRDVLNILFVGLMHYEPNRDGVKWFCGDILPLIRSLTHVRCRISIVGFDPPADVQALAGLDNVVVTGGVESVRPYYEASDLVIAPIRFGAGTRIKILEAMSYQKPVVSTTIGAEGIDIEDGRNILLADTPDAFARACVTLLESAALRQSLGREGRKRLEEKYSESVVSEKLNRILTL